METFRRREGRKFSNNKQCQEKSGNAQASLSTIILHSHDDYNLHNARRHCRWITNPIDSFQVSYERIKIIDRQVNDAHNYCDRTNYLRDHLYSYYTRRRQKITHTHFSYYRECFIHFSIDFWIFNCQRLFDLQTFRLGTNDCTFNFNTSVDRCNGKWK